jgi:hypothetical protein
LRANRSGGSLCNLIAENTSRNGTGEVSAIRVAIAKGVKRFVVMGRP